MTQLDIDVELEGIVSAYVKTAPFDEAKALLNENGFRIISAEEEIFLILKQGKGSSVFEESNWVREGFIHIPKKDVLFLVRHSPILDNPKKAPKLDFPRKEFYLTEEQVEKALEDSVQIPYGLDYILVDRFGDEEITDFIFGSHAKAYGEFLRDVWIRKMPLWYVDKGSTNAENEPFARQLWLNNSIFESGLGVGGGTFYNVVRGIHGDTKNVAKTLNTKKEKPKYINPFEIEIPEVKKEK